MGFLFFNLAMSQVYKKDSLNNDLRLENLPYYSYGKGVGITSPDSIFKFNIRFRMQNRVSYIKNEDSPEAIDGRIRRLRLRFDGFVGDPKFLYVVQLSFAPEDVGEINAGSNLNVIRDAAIIYRANKHWNIIFGQTKIPGNRQRINSSGALQFTDRTINNATFNIDRDFGLQVYYLNSKADEFYYNIKTAITNGEGRNFTDNTDTNLAYTTKFECFPFGAFANDGTMFEGDLMREPKPKLFLGLAYSQNNNTKRTSGQLGAELFEPRTLKYVFGDMMFKYRGFALMYAYHSRNTTNPITVNPLNSSDILSVYVGNGSDYKASYLLPSNYEFLMRYSHQQPNASIQSFTPKATQF